MELNAVGDLVLDSPEALRAIGDPGRLALLDRLRRGGPATTDELGEDEALPELERLGFVTRAGDRWSAVGNWSPNSMAAAAGMSQSRVARAA